ncbi:hypothetical protein CHS0354_005799 [Potamilus streckersoni]|uniref:SAM domain-containing protein n=1 Tax=Potamilus streckersoni TaxID=2493646 RepID=A0AAE0SV59_9BIVA|nr:hypothetical protein CHS0354_005799 [Potamilus streckersoni]
MHENTKKEDLELRGKIAKYKSNNLSKHVCKEKQVDDLTYETILPHAYTNISYDDAGFYEPVKISAGQMDGSKNDQIPMSALSTEGNKPPKISPKPNIKQKEVSDEVLDDSPPPIPRRLPACPPLKPNKMKVLLPSHKVSYDNSAYQMETPPVMYLKPICKANPPRIEESQTQHSKLQQPKHNYATGIINVKILKIDELGRWMADNLGLGDYVARFAEEMVDGTMLLELDENILRHEFKLSQIEAKRLMKFAREGHAPQ